MSDQASPIAEEVNLRVYAMRSIAAVEKEYPDTGAEIRRYVDLLAAERMRLWEAHQRCALAASVGDAPSDAVAAMRIPPLNDDLRDILGRMCFTLTGLANAMRKAGHTIKPRAEDEQAAALHFLLTIYAENGPAYKSMTADQLRERAERLATEPTAPPAAPVVSDAVKWAQGLIEQLPRDHDGRNSWLLNHGIGEEPDWLRAEYARHRAAWKEWREGMPQPEMRKYEKVYACDYCGSDYTDAKYCCAARREYLNAHGEFETGRAPAASVGSDWRIDTSAGGPILVYQNCSVIEGEQAEYVLRLIAADAGKKPNPWGVYLEARANIIDWFHSQGHSAERIADVDLRMDPEQVDIIRNRDRSSAPPSLISVPATDDKAPAVDAEPFYYVEKSGHGWVIYAWRTGPRSWIYNFGHGDSAERFAKGVCAELLKERAELLAAPTSPHDVDAVRVDEAMVERAVDAYDDVYEAEAVAGVWGDNKNAAMRAALTAALRKPGEA